MLFANVHLIHHALRIVVLLNAFVCHAEALHHPM
ncbi:Uncharacterised protein [Klebsiella pneumoniae]|nr:Uncharacterised protein [Klebsiella pneumoniae]